MKMILTNILDAFVFKDLNVYVYKDMDELRTCTRCTKNMELQYFLINRKGEHYKCCKDCNNKRYDWNQKPEIKEYAKQYYQEHKEHTIQRNRQWRQTNKDILTETVVCEICGAETHRCSQTKHKKTKKCKEALKLNMNSHI